MREILFQRKRDVNIKMKILKQRISLKWLDYEYCLEAVKQDRDALQ